MKSKNKQVWKWSIFTFYSNLLDNLILSSDKFLVSVAPILHKFILSVSEPPKLIIWETATVMNIDWKVKKKAQ